MKRRLGKFVLALIGPIAMIVILSMPIGLLYGGLGGVIQPIGGVFDVGRGVSMPYGQSMKIPGLDSDVEVVFDRWGIPHIYAESVHDAFLVLGYLHARERLFQMVLQDYFAAGRLGEVVGREAVSSDKFYRTIGLARAARATYQWYLDNAEHNTDVAYALELVDAEVAGVNAFIDSMTSETTPVEFKLLGFTPEHWTPVDIFLWAKMMSWSLSGSIYDLYRQWVRQTIGNDTMYNELFPDLLPYTVPIIPEQTDLSLEEFPNAPGGFPATSVPPRKTGVVAAQTPTIDLTKLRLSIDVFEREAGAFGYGELLGSNNWVVDGVKSATGHPILANDPHLPLQAPSLWYEAHIVVPGVLDVMGVTFPGLPGVVLGHTAKTAWGFTNVGADVLDIFVEELNPSNPNQYMYNGAYRDFEIVDETIHVKGGGHIPYEVKWSVHGPCIDSVVNTYDLDQDIDPNLAMNWTGLGVTHELMSLAMLNKAGNLQEYFEAVYWWDSPPQNIVFADDAGNIAMTVAGRFPVRTGYTGEYPVTALNDSVGMTSSIPYAFNPRSVNPSQHYLQSANQRPTDPSTYRYDILGPFDDGYRGRRIDYLLSRKPSVTVDDMKSFQADALDVSAQELVPYVISAWNNAGDGNTTVQAAVNWLSGWDYVMETNSPAPTLWRYLLSAMQHETFDELRSISTGLLLSRTPVLEKLIKENVGHYFDDHTTSGTVETRDEILVRALHRALDNMASELGMDSSTWNYGNHHSIYIDHLARLTYIGGGPHRGDQYTLNAAGGWRVTYGPSWRMVADMGNVAQSYGVYPGGQSGNPFSSHWSDLFDLWYAYKKEIGQYGYHTMYFYVSSDRFRDADDARTMIAGSTTFTP